MSKGALVEGDATQLFNLARRLDDMDKPIQKAIKKTLTDEMRKVVSAVRDAELAIPVKSGGPTTAFKPVRHRRFKAGDVVPIVPFQHEENINVRQAMAKGVRSAVRYGSYNNRGASIAIEGRSTYLPPEKKSLNRLLNWKSFRHPVFAHGGSLGGVRHGSNWTWVEQKGHPFWGRTTSKFRQPVHEALVKAVEQSITTELHRDQLHI